VSGISGTVREVHIGISLWAGGSQVSDAWRFDSQGCEAGQLYVRHAASSTACPHLRGDHPIEVSRVDYFAFASGDWSKGREDIFYGVLFDPFVSNPSVQYTLAQFELDHSDAALGGNAVPGSCGCLERPLCISVRDFSYVDGAGVTHDYNFWYSTALHWNDPGNSLLCPGGPDLCNPPCLWDGDTLCVATVPASMQSWGRVKAGYR
jgi:hypothetical protein